VGSALAVGVAQAQAAAAAARRAILIAVVEFFTEGMPS
jgi:hypothetical protein